MTAELTLTSVCICPASDSSAPTTCCLACKAVRLACSASLTLAFMNCWYFVQVLRWRVMPDADDLRGHRGQHRKSDILQCELDKLELKVKTHL